MRAFVIAAALGLAGTVLFSPARAKAHDPRYSGYSGYNSNYYDGYGFGRHDLRPHWHQTYTPYGIYEWYGTGRHDLRPHDHEYTPYGTRSNSYTPWGYTESYSPRYRSYYWGR